MTFDEYQEAALRTASDEALTDRQYGAAAICGEAGEYSELVKKWRYHGKPWQDEKAIEELGDTLWGLAAACAENGYTLDEVARANIEKLRSRYPDGFVPGGGNR